MKKARQILSQWGSLSVLAVAGVILSAAAARAGDIQKYEFQCPSGYEKHGSSTVYCEKVTKSMTWTVPSHTYAYQNCSNPKQAEIDAGGNPQDECNNTGSGSDRNISCKSGELVIVVSKAHSPSGNGYDRCYDKCKVGRWMRKVKKDNDQDYADVDNRDVVDLTKYDIKCTAGEEKTKVYAEPTISKAD